MASRSKTAADWIEAMRLRTLPVSLAGVVYAAGFGVLTWHFRLIPLILCLLFALLAQIASNFANEYYDFKRGFDRAGRVGPRRGVTEGDISPEAMKYATFATLGVACAVGCILVATYGEWWMYAVGVLTALGVVAYSTGPYPLSHHGLGEVAVVCFFGIIPVCLTGMLMGSPWSWVLFASSVGLGLMGANVLIVNNYRDADDDRAVGKRTLAVMLGRKAMVCLYYSNGIAALILTMPAMLAASQWWWVVPAVYLLGHTAICYRLTRLSGRALNPLLGMTSVLMLVYAVGFLLTVSLSA